MEGMRECMGGTFSLSLLYFFPALPSPADMHVRIMNQTPSPLSHMSGRPYSRYRFVGCPTNSPIVLPPPPFPDPLALSTYALSGQICRGGGIVSVFCVYIPGDQLVVVYFC